MKAAVSIYDIEEVRADHHSEVTLENRSDYNFSIIFKGRKKNLDLVANSAKEAQYWINGLNNLKKYYTRKEWREKRDFVMTEDVLPFILMSPGGNIFNQEHNKVYPVMTKPLNQNHISFSQNCYMIRYQLEGPNRVKAYVSCPACSRAASSSIAAGLKVPAATSSWMR
ncbi:uncharacterized protein [Mobula birostris]|uniref:uncharacterized protein isoform X3 n=1 Tax=Mobula birostris TaxID=1983395 RepID=UPI003B284703